jgi:hypothetical protein
MLTGDQVTNIVMITMKITCPTELAYAAAALAVEVTTEKEMTQ